MLHQRWFRKGNAPLAKEFTQATHFVIPNSSSILGGSAFISRKG
jgi:hypothetical protein